MHECLYALEPNIAKNSLVLWHPYSAALSAQLQHQYCFYVIYKARNHCFSERNGGTRRRKHPPVEKHFGSKQVR